MEYSLVDIIKMRGGKLEEREAAMVTREIARGVKYMHDQGLVHFDLKPANILVNLDPQTGFITSLKISDFGLTKPKQDKFSTGTHLQGTISFMAPEMLTRDKTFDSRIEAWSLGIILYQMLIGKLPFNTKDQKKLARKIVLTDIDHDSDAWHGLSIEAQDLLENLLIKDPDMRLTIQDVLINSWIVDTSVE